MFNGVQMIFIGRLSLLATRRRDPPRTFKQADEAEGWGLIEGTPWRSHKENTYQHQNSPSKSSGKVDRHSSILKSDPLAALPLIRQYSPEPEQKGVRRSTGGQIEEKKMGNKGRKSAYASFVQD